VADVIATATLLGQRTAIDHANQVLDIAREAESIDEFRAALWEMYDQVDVSRSAELLTQGSVAANLIRRADVAARGGE
jgi:hypothetical protein